MNEQEYQLLPKNSLSNEKVRDRFDEESMIGSSSSDDDSVRTRIPHRQDLKGVKEHIEEHFDRPELIKDCILGLSDGLTVPFALAAGLSSLGDSKIVLFGGLAGNCFKINYENKTHVILNRAGLGCYFYGIRRLFSC